MVHRESEELSSAMLALRAAEEELEALKRRKLEKEQQLKNLRDFIDMKNKIKLGLQDDMELPLEQKLEQLRKLEQLFSS